MNKRLGFIKTTVVGGFVFLIPAAIVIVALGKVIGTLKALAKALSPLFGIESLVGGFVLELPRDHRDRSYLLSSGTTRKTCKRQTLSGAARHHFVELLPRIRFYQRIR